MFKLFNSQSYWFWFYYSNSFIMLWVTANLNRSYFFFIFTFVMFFPINCTTCLGHSIYYEFTRNLITLIHVFVYDYKNKTLHFLPFQSLTFFSIQNSCSLFIAFKDQVIFILPHNCAYSCAIFWLQCYINMSDFILWLNVTKENSWFIFVPSIILSYKPFNAFIQRY